MSGCEHPVAFLSGDDDPETGEIWLWCRGCGSWWPEREAGVELMLRLFASVIQAASTSSSGGGES